MFIKDPSAVEVVFRNEGKYPVRTKEMEEDVRDLIRKAGHEPSFASL